MIWRPSLLELLWSPAACAAAAAAPAGRERPVAVIVFHGMGQQVRYGTIEETVTLLEAAALREGAVLTLIGRRQLPREDQFVPCAELALVDGSGAREIHVYEVYWAPLTEGRISTWETFSFLVGSAWECLWNGRRFHRILFRPGGPRRGAMDPPFRGPWTTTLGLAMAALTMGALWVFDAVLLAVVASGILMVGEPPWFRRLAPGLVGDYVSALLVLLAAGLFALAPWRAFPIERRGGRPALRLLSRVGDGALKLAAAALVVIAARIVVRIGGEALGAWPPGSAPAPPARALLIGVGALVFALSAVVRHFILQYVGDVAIYLSAHKANRFYEARQAIQKTARDLAHFVFDRRGADGESLYPRVVLAGHSLGSVIGYDALNRLLLEDRTTGTDRQVRRRTAAFITYGSPLDKTAYVFRTQRRKDGSLREAMAAGAQPLIQDRSARLLPWINVFARADWIGGDLDYYDRPAGWPGPHAPRPVVNVEDDHALTPLAAHGEHVRSPVLQRVVLDALRCRLDRNPDVRAARERRRRAPAAARW